MEEPFDGNIKKLKKYLIDSNLEGEEMKNKIKEVVKKFYNGMSKEEFREWLIESGFEINE